MKMKAPVKRLVEIAGLKIEVFDKPTCHDVGEHFGVEPGEVSRITSLFIETEDKMKANKDLKGFCEADLLVEVLKKEQIELDGNNDYFLLGFMSGTHNMLKRVIVELDKDTD